METPVVLPRNFFGGFVRSPASGQTTQRSSTNLKSIKEINIALIM